MRNTRRSQNEVKEKIKEVDRLVASGVGITKALREVRVHGSTYYKYKREEKAFQVVAATPKRKVKTPSLLTLSVPNPTESMVVLMGHSGDVLKALDRMAQIQGRLQ